ncbi:MAG: MmgE/PrpD family protein [Methanobacteriaceae archaeon]|nr:MmgE/PrpD family protein [Methanobacteriaceae archaeon]
MITDSLASFICNTHYENLPADVVEKAKLCFMDFLGVSLGGSRTRSSQIIGNIVGSHGSSTIIGGSKTSALEASLVNGVSAHSLDLDDGHRQAQLHPGACVIPAALSLSESHEVSGKDLIESMVVGYQIAVLMGIIANPNHRRRGFHSTGTCGTFGAAAAASKVLKLDEESIVNCFGLAGTQAAGLLESDHAGTMGKHLHPGRAAQSGVLSALIAQKGFTGAKSIIDGKEGFLRATSQIELAKIAIAKEDLWKSYYILGVYFKKYPVCRHLHSSIDAAMSLMQKNNINPDNIVNVTVNTYKIAAEHDEYHPHSPEAVRQSLPVSLALAISKGLNQTLHINAEILNLASKVSMKCDPNLESLYPEQRPSQVIITTREGSWEETVHLPQGEPEKPFNWNDILTKFRLLNPEVDLKTLNIMKNIESYEVTELISIINRFVRKG